MNIFEEKTQELKDYNSFYVVFLSGKLCSFDTKTCFMSRAQAREAVRKFFIHQIIERYRIHCLESEPSDAMEKAYGDFFSYCSRELYIKKITKGMVLRNER